jgi:hypothetical protein
MSYQDVYIAEQTMARSLVEKHHEAAAIHRAHEHHRQRRRWLVHQLGCLLSYVGSWLLRHADNLQLSIGKQEGERQIPV